jgi:hypothetical protein
LKLSSKKTSIIILAVFASIFVAVLVVAPLVSASPLVGQFGYQTQGGSTDWFNAGNIEGSEYTYSGLTGGNLTSVTFYIGQATSGHHIAIGIYNWTTNTGTIYLLANSTVNTSTSNGWNVFNFPTGLSLVNGNKYWIVYWSDVTLNSNGYYYTTGTSYQSFYYSATYNGSQWPTSISSYSARARQISEYANFSYTPVTFTSNPTGSGYITVNGSAVTTPYSFSGKVGDTYTIAANSPANTVAGQSQYLYSSWNDSGAQSHVYTVVDGGSNISASFTEQFYLTVTGGSSPTGQGWVNSGSTTTAGNAWVWGRSAGKGYALTNWQLDGSNQGVGTRLNTGSFTTPSITMSTYHTANFVNVTQYQITLDATSTAALAGFTASPTISGDNYWFDSGTVVGVNLNGVWGRSGGTGNRLTGWQINSGANHPVSTTGNVQPYFDAISGLVALTSTSAVQFQLTVSGGNGVTYGTSSTVSGDTGWYDTGTATTVSSNWAWSTVAGQSQTGLFNYQIDSVDQNPTQLFTGTLTSSSITMSATHNLSFESTSEWYVTVISAYGSPTGQKWVNNNGGVTSTVTTPSNGFQTSGWTETGNVASGGTLGTSTTGLIGPITTYGTVTWSWVADPAVISGISTNSTVVGSQCAFNFTVSDPNGATLSDYIFGTNNTGSWVNSTATAFSSTPQTLSLTKTLNTLSGSNVTYELWTNDTNNDWSNSGLQTLTLTVGPADHLIVSATYSTIVSGLTQPYDAKAYDKYSNYISDVSTSANWSISAGAAGTWVSNVYSAGNPSISSPYTITAQYNNATGTISLTITSPGGTTYSNNSTLPLGSVTFAVSSLQLGTLKVNQTVTTSITVTFSGSSFQVTGVTVSAPFDKWMIPGSVSGQILTQHGDGSTTTATIAIAFKVASNAAGPYSGTVQVSGEDTFGNIHTAVAHITANIDSPSNLGNYLQTHVWVIALIVGGIIAALASVAVFSKRRH